MILTLNRIGIILSQTRHGMFVRRGCLCGGDVCAKVRSHLIENDRGAKQSEPSDGGLITWQFLLKPLQAIKEDKHQASSHIIHSSFHLPKLEQNRFGFLV